MAPDKVTQSCISASKCMIKAVALVNPVGLVSLWACSVDLAMSVVQCVGLSLATHDHRRGGWAHALLSTVVISSGQ